MGCTKNGSLRELRFFCDGTDEVLVVGRGSSVAREGGGWVLFFSAPQ
jgi:hypothetical protein